MAFKRYTRAQRRGTQGIPLLTINATRIALNGCLAAQLGADKCRTFDVFVDTEAAMLGLKFGKDGMYCGRLIKNGGGLSLGILRQVLTDLNCEVKTTRLRALPSRDGMDVCFDISTIAPRKGAING